jgi:hypothetical protein
MDKFIRPLRENTRQPGFWKIANGGSDDEADPRDQIESQAREVLDNIEQASINYATSQSSSPAPSESASQSQPLVSLFDPFLKPPEPK